MTYRVKESTVKRVLKSMCPNRQFTGYAVTHITIHVNDYLREIIDKCEKSLKEINDNPNSYYKQHRYDLNVVKLAFQKLREGNR